jgi:hypothetical protein
MRLRGGWLGFGLVAVLVFTRTASAYFLDSDRRFDVRLRAYSQLGVLTDSSETAGCPTDTQLAKAKAISDPAQRQAKLAQLMQTCPPSYSAGDLAQHRNFYNPEFDANLTDFMHWSGADEFKFRFAWWGFYDGLYDYLNPEWNDHRRDILTRFSQTDRPNQESKFFQDQNKNARKIYAERNRINELYFDYSSGPFFLRVGRQAISWGESDTIALLDVQNPFDLTLGAPGFFEDVDEARIPLWTVRSTMKLLESAGPLSSVFGDVYLVPGPIDTTVPITPLEGGVSPFNPDVADPQLNIVSQGAFGQQLHTVVADQLPASTWSNSRWGARLTGVLLRDYTVQGWFFRTFNQQPQPLLTNQSAIGLVGQKMTTLIDDRGFRVPECIGITSTNKVGHTPDGRACANSAPVVTLLQHRLESVLGFSATWFSQPVNGILKAEAEFFNKELAFIPTQNLNPRVQIPGPLRKAIGDNGTYVNHGATANYLRWVVGYDRNFFVPWLNPSNSFILVTSYNSQLNLSETGSQDYRNANAKPGHPQTFNGVIPGTTAFCNNAASAKSNPVCVQINPHDYEDAYKYEGFLTTTVRTDYMHGKLEPGITVITDVSGIFAVNPGVTYRLTDNVLFGLNYLTIDGPRKAGLGTFRAHDMIQARVTVQLN